MKEAMKVRDLVLSEAVKRMTAREICGYTCQYLDEDFIKENMNIGSCEDCPYASEDEFGYFDCPHGMDYTDYHCPQYLDYAHMVRAYLVEADLRLRKTLGDLYEDEYTAE